MHRGKIHVVASHPPMGDVSDRFELSYTGWYAMAARVDLVFLLEGEGRNEVLLQGGRPPRPSQADVLRFVS